MAQTSHPVASTHLTLRNAVNFRLVAGGRQRVHRNYGKLDIKNANRNQPHFHTAFQAMQVAKCGHEYMDQCMSTNGDHR